MGRGSKKVKNKRQTGRTHFKQKLHKKYLDKNIATKEIRVYIFNYSFFYLQERWDFNKTMKQNFENLGLVLDPNDTKSNVVPSNPIEFGGIFFI